MNGIDPYVLPGVAAAIALLVGILIGRAGRPARKRWLALEAELAERNDRIESLSVARAELEAHREELGMRLIAAEREAEQRREQLTDYQKQVVGHFNETSDLLKGMTLQYRNIYQHLSAGAEALCPEGTPRLERDTPIDGLLGTAPEETEPGSPEEDAESSEAVHRDAPLQVDPRPEA